MKRIAEADHAAHRYVVSDHARNSATHRLAADHERAAATGLADRITKRLHQHARRIRCSPLAGLPPPLHVRKLKSDHPYAGRCNSFCDTLHEKRIHRRARAMHKQKRFRRRLWSIDNQRRHDVESSNARCIRATKFDFCFWSVLREWSVRMLPATMPSGLGRVNAGEANRRRHPPLRLRRQLTLKTRSPIDRLEDDR